MTMDRTNKNVLVIDDEPALLEIHEWILRDLGFANIRLHASALSAAQEIRAGFVPDLILLDLLMPGRDGVEFLRDLRDIGFAGDLILVSGQDDRTLRSAQRLIQAHGMSVLGRLAKPLDRNELGRLLGTRESLVMADCASAVESPEELHRGVNRGEFRNLYQPQVSLEDGEVVEVRCVPMWQHPTRGPLGVEDFLAVAKSEGLAPAIFHAALRTALDDLPSLAFGGSEPRLGISLPVSVLASSDFAEIALRSVFSASLSPHRLVFQIHEAEYSSALDDMPEPLIRLKMAGFGLSFDHFGSGFGFLARLEAIPFDEVRIEGTSVHSIDEREARALALECLALGRKLEMRTVAKGVKSADELALLERAHCDAVEGPFIGELMSREAFIAWRACRSRQSKSLFSVERITDDASEVKVLERFLDERERAHTRVGQLAVRVA